MKLITLITASSITATAFAGEPAPVQPASAPAAAPTLGGWFVGATYGMLETDSNIEDVASDLGYNGSIDDFEFDMYTLHVGQDLGTQFLGCDLAAYFEVGYINGDATGTLFGSTPLLDINADIDIEIVPITINLKAERMFFAGIKGYITAGIGYAFTSTDVQGLGSEDDGGFYAQATMGLAYDINEQWEIYGGARWLYLSDLDLGYGDAELDDNVGYEIGLRYSF
jgi:opacity protein-like surface antigen